MDDGEFLSQMPIGGPEREYHAELLRLVRTANFELKECVGQALMRVLDISLFAVGEVDSLTHPAAGSVYENAVLVAHVFQSVNPSPSWWKARYESMSAEDFDDKCVQFWVGVFRASPRTTRFDFM